MLSDDRAIYWACAHTWSVADVFWLVEMGEEPPFDPQDLTCENSEAPHATRMRAYDFIGQLRHFTGLEFNDETSIFRGDIRISPNGWLVLCDKAKMQVSDVLRSAVMVNAEATKERQPPCTLTENSALATIAALLAAWPGGKVPSGKDLEKAAASVGVAITDDTIRKSLKAARGIARGLPTA